MIRINNKKNIFVFSLCIALTCSGCAKDGNVEKNITGITEVYEEETEEYAAKEGIEALDIPENMLAYWMVVNNRKPFVSANEGCQEFFWDEYFWCTSEPALWLTIDCFGIVDLDNDGSEEMVLEGSVPDTRQVLDYQEGKVYSYQFPFRGMAGICTNGVYGSSSASDIGGFHRISFDKGTYEEETLAYMEHDYFEVEGKQVSSEEFFAYTETFTKAEMIESMKFEEEMLDKILLGDLDEEELSIVKRVEPEKICDENNPQMADVPEAYLAVLTGSEEFICVTEEGQRFIVDGNCIRNSTGEEEYQILYFSMVDMEGDGEDEVVLTCADETLILHAVEDSIYGYVFEFWNEIGAITKDGVFKTGFSSENKYGKIISFEKDECRIETVEDYESSNHDRIRYYFFNMPQTWEIENDIDENRDAWGFHAIEELFEMWEWYPSSHPTSMEEIADRAGCTREYMKEQIGNAERTLLLLSERKAGKPGLAFYTEESEKQYADVAWDAYAFTYAQTMVFNSDSQGFFGHAYLCNSEQKWKDSKSAVFISYYYRFETQQLEIMEIVEAATEIINYACILEYEGDTQKVSLRTEEGVRLLNPAAELNPCKKALPVPGLTGEELEQYLALVFLDIIRNSGNLDKYEKVFTEDTFSLLQQLNSYYEYPEEIYDFARFEFQTETKGEVIITSQFQPTLWGSVLIDIAIQFEYDNETGRISVEEGNFLLAEKP